MPRYEPMVPARYCVLLIDFLQSMPAPAIKSMLAAAAMDENLLRCPDAALNIGQVERLVAAIQALTGRTDLGFELGQRITVDQHGPLAQALKRCRTLDEGLRLIARYFRVITPSFFLRYRRHADSAELIYRPAALMAPTTLNLFMEINAGSFHTQVAAALGRRLAPYDLYLSMDAPPHVKRYGEIKPARVHFGRSALPEVRAVISARLADLPLRPSQSAAPEPVSVDASGIRVGEGAAARWREWVVMMLREADGCQPSIEELAAMVDISSRTLSRHLAAAGSSFRVLASEIRHARACAMLAAGEMAVSQVAFRLGYGDAANFSHAFRARSGMSPRLYRRRCMA